MRNNVLERITKLEARVFDKLNNTVKSKNYDPEKKNTNTENKKET